MLFKKLILSLIIVLAIIINPIALYAISLVPGGDSIGIDLNYQGVVITGGYKIKSKIQLMIHLQKILKLVI